MSKYLIHVAANAKRIGGNEVAAVIDIRDGFDYERAQTDFFELHGDPEATSFRFAELVKLWDHTRIGDVYYDEELAGPDGCSYMIINLPGHKTDINMVKRRINEEQDAVRVFTLKVSKLVEFDTATYHPEQVAK